MHIGVARRPIDLQGFRPKVDLIRMTGGARHSNPITALRRVFYESDR